MNNWVDRLFGTLYLPKDKHPARYGIDQQLSPTLLGQLIDPFIPARKASSSISSEEVPAADQKAMNLQSAQTADSQTVTGIEG